MIQLTIEDKYFILPDDNKSQGGSEQKSNEVMQFLRQMQELKQVKDALFEAMGEPIEPQGMEPTPGEISEEEAEGQGVKKNNQSYFDKLRNIVSRSKGTKKKRW